MNALARLRGKYCTLLFHAATVKLLSKVLAPSPSLGVCVADGDALPERFDHIHTLLDEQVP